MKLETGDTLYAQFMPEKRDDLKPEALEAIGKYGKFSVGWTIEESDNSDYTDQLAMIPELKGPFKFGWTPLCDLRVIGKEEYDLYTNKNTIIIRHNEAGKQAWLDYVEVENITRPDVYSDKALSIADINKLGKYLADKHGLKWVPVKEGDH